MSVRCVDRTKMIAMAPRDKLEVQTGQSNNLEGPDEYWIISNLSVYYYLDSKQCFAFGTNGVPERHPLRKELGTECIVCVYKSFTSKLPMSNSQQAVDSSHQTCIPPSPPLLLGFSSLPTIAPQSTKVSNQNAHPSPPLSIFTTIATTKSRSLNTYRLPLSSTSPPRAGTVRATPEATTLHLPFLSTYAV